MKKLLPLLIVGIFVFSGFGIGAFTDDNILNNLQFQRNCENNIIKDGDELDQYQLEMYSFGYIGRTPDSPHIYYIVAQGFTPTKSILTRVELMVSKNVTTTYDLTLAIRDNLTGPDLISISKNPVSIPTENFSWIEFDFDNIKVTPGFTYYIVCSTIDASDNRYAWGVEIDNVYPNGTISWSEDGQEWYYDTWIDATFLTFGRDNYPPNAPVIVGPHKLKPNEEGTFTVSATDPDGDDVKYHIDWGDGDFETTGFNSSGDDVIVKHTWNNRGTYIIRAKAEDEFGLVGPESTFVIGITNKTRAINTPFQWFLQQHPYLFPILRLLMQRLGLQ